MARSLQIDWHMKETLSITKALVELKTLNKRIDKKIAQLDPIAVSTGDKLPERIKSHEDFIDKAKADFQSIQDLIARRAKIKSAVVQSNALTKVTIAGATLTVAEAIERKSSIESEKSLQRQLAARFTEGIDQVENFNQSLKGQLLKLLEATYSKSEAQISKDDHDKVAIPFFKNNEAKIIDPLDAKKLQETLDDKISAFEDEVDVALSESNARTDITLN